MNGICAEKWVIISDILYLPRFDKISINARCMLYVVECIFFRANRLYAFFFASLPKSTSSVIRKIMT